MGRQFLYTNLDESLSSAVPVAVAVAVAAAVACRCRGCCRRCRCRWRSVGAGVLRFGLPPVRVWRCRRCALSSALALGVALVLASSPPSAGLGSLLGGPLPFASGGDVGVAFGVPSFVGGGGAPGVGMRWCRRRHRRWHRRLWWWAGLSRQQHLVCSTHNGPAQPFEAAAARRPSQPPRASHRVRARRLRGRWSTTCRAEHACPSLGRSLTGQVPSCGRWRSALRWAPRSFSVRNLPLRSSFGALPGSRFGPHRRERVAPVGAGRRLRLLRLSTGRRIL